MTEKTILLDVEDKIATITLNRPERKNAINTNMVNDWVEILDECRDNDDIAAIILTGAGEAFCAGGDKANLGANNKIDPLETKNHFWDHFQRVAKRTALIEKPIVAAVNGMATGAGMDMSLHCDIRFALSPPAQKASPAPVRIIAAISSLSLHSSSISTQSLTIFVLIAFFLSGLFKVIVAILSSTSKSIVFSVIFFPKKLYCRYRHQSLNFDQ
jgi:hypothetical protein